jgi:hypothetical protein
MDLVFQEHMSKKMLHMWSTYFFVVDTNEMVMVPRAWTSLFIKHLMSLESFEWAKTIQSSDAPRGLLEPHLENVPLLLPKHSPSVRETPTKQEGARYHFTRNKKESQR